MGEGGWVEGWGGDPNGLHVGRQITIYRPSLKLSDYRLEFQGSIDTKSVGWVFRAADPENYYAMKLMTVSSGLSPKVALFKYLVVEWKQTQVGRVPIDLAVQPDTVFDVRVDVRGPQFTTYHPGTAGGQLDRRSVEGGWRGLPERTRRTRKSEIGVDPLPERREQVKRRVAWNRRTINGYGLLTTSWWRLWRAPTFWTPRARSVRCNRSTLAKALALNMDGKTEQALREIREAIDGGENLPELAWTKAHLEFQLGHFENALEDYQKVLETQPSHKAATYNAALCLEKLKRYEEAAAAFRKAADLDPKLTEAILGVGVSELHCKRPESALAAFEECLKAQPGNSRALYGKAVALHLLGRTEEAMEFYQKLLPNNSTDAELVTNMIRLALARGEHDKAREYSEKLLRLRPNAQAGLAGMIAAAMARGDYKSAAQLGAQLVKTASSSFEAWFNLGVAYQKTNRLEQAGQAYAEAVETEAG